MGMGREVASLYPYHDDHNRNCVSTTHFKFQILQLECIAGVSLCRLVVTSSGNLLEQVRNSHFFNR